MKRLFTLLALLLVFAAIAIPVIEAADPAPKKAVPQEQTYWLTIKSGIRHNSKCRYYENSRGRHCKKDEGKACKICGG